MYNTDHHGTVSDLAHHGDVHIIRRAVYEKACGDLRVGNVIAQNNDQIVLAEGEVTGHHHVIQEQGAELFEIAANDNQTGIVGLLKVTNKVTVRHQEHPQLDIPPGEWVILLPREYDDEDAWRTVVD